MSAAIDYEALARALLAQGLPEAVADQLRGAVAPAPELLTRDGLARALHVSVLTVDRWAKRGMPREMLAGLPRFDLAACRAWLQKQPAQKRVDRASEVEHHLPPPRLTSRTR